MKRRSAGPVAIGGGRRWMSKRAAAFAQYQRSMRLFSRDIVGVPLHRYQHSWADYVLEVAVTGRNEVVTVEMPRQSGKNETSAQLEAALLARLGRKGGSIVKCAPTWKPQIVNSKLRLEQRAAQVQARLPFLAYRSRMGYMMECGRAVLAFLSADPGASVVGATASTLMEVDEAQDVDKAKFEKDFSPMRASTGAPIVAYGTTWTDDTLLESFKRDIQDGRTPGRVIRVLPDQVADENPAYGDFVDSEVARKGRNHPLIKTQYFLEPLDTGGRAIPPQALRLMAGEHQPRQRRTNEHQIVAGIDFAGADENAGSLEALVQGSTRDSVALTVGELTWMVVADGVYEPVVRIVARYEWQNQHPASLQGVLFDVLWNRWRVDVCICDETGVGETNTRFLQRAINKPSREHIIGVKFDGAWNTDTTLASEYMATVLGARLFDYQSPTGSMADAGQEIADPHDADRRAWWQRGHARLEARAGQRFRLRVPQNEGHDDILLSEQLMVHAAYQAGQPRTMKSGRVSFYG